MIVFSLSSLDFIPLFLFIDLFIFCLAVSLIAISTLKGHSKVLDLCFSYAAVLSAYCSRFAGLQWRHIALVIVGCVLMLASRHLSMG